MDNGIDAIDSKHGNHASMYLHVHGGAVRSFVTVYQDLVKLRSFLHSVHEGLVHRDARHPGHTVLVLGLQILNA
ncbi:hypothetical protein D3C76_1745620 [compost metagenome]